MALLNPVYAIVLPFLFIFTIPIAITASITTFISFSILLVRVVLVYIELALAIIPHYLLGESSKSKSLQTAKFYASPTGVRRRKRRTSSSSNLSCTGTITPVPGDNLLGLSQSIGPTRDFEGVGGWRLDNPSDDDTLWTNINSRLELPADHGRRHHRSLTSGSMPGDARANRSYSPEAVMNTSRARTPPSSAVGIGGEYFPQAFGTTRGLKRNNSGVMGMSGSSGSSKGSSVLNMKQR
jgi:hypothetical protein